MPASPSGSLQPTAGDFSLVSCSARFVLHEAVTDRLVLACAPSAVSLCARVSTHSTTATLHLCLALARGRAVEADNTIDQMRC